MALTLHPIAPDDGPRVGAFLHEHLNERVGPDVWAGALDVPWTAERPNGGFMLLDDGTIVGAHLAFYSERTIDGRRERFCNLGAWCVLPAYRFHGLRLLKALLAQDGYTFTDLSPSGSVVDINTRLSFRFLDTAAALVPNLPWPSLPGRTEVIADRAGIEQVLTGDQLQLYRDHASAAAARHVVLRRGDRWCYVVFRKDRRRGLPLFASVLHVSDRELFARCRHPFARHLLLRHGMPAMLAEDRIVGRRPRLALDVKATRRKMFRSTNLDAAQIDYFYSELVCVPW